MQAPLFFPSLPAAWLSGGQGETWPPLCRGPGPAQSRAIQEKVENKCRAIST